MATRVLPSAAEIEALVPRPGSAVWRHAGDVRLLAGAGCALILQVAHPTVAAGVAEHSNFAADPWGRLLRTLDYVNASVFGGPDLAAETGRRVRAMHRQIKGIRADGEPYHALEPRAYAWVHATLAHSIVTANEQFVGPLADAEVGAFYAEWRGLGRLVGVRPDDLPADWPSFRDYFDAMVRHELEDNATVHQVLDSLRAPLAPSRLPQPLWRVARLPATRMLSLATVGLLPAALRRRLNLSWSALDAAALRSLAAGSRAGTRLLPRAAREFGPAYLRWRQAGGTL